MRVAIFSDIFYPGVGGIEDSTRLLGQELAARGHAVDFFVPWAPRRNYEMVGAPHAELDLGKNVTVHRLASFPYPGPKGQDRFVFPTGLRWLWMFAHRPDVIHVHTFFGAGCEGFIAAKMLRVPLVGTNHLAISEFVRYSPVGKNRALTRIALRFVARFYGRCDFVTAPSRAVFDEMSASGFRAPHAVVSNPIDTRLFRAARTARETADGKKKFGLSAHTAVFAGRLAAEKRYDVLIRAVALARKEIPDLVFAIAGFGKKEAALKSLVRELGVEANVKFLGVLDQTDLAELFRASEVFIIASKSETQNMALLQAMSCGLPAIGVRARALPEYILPETGFIVEPDAIADFAERLAIVFQDEALRRRLGAAAAARAQEYAPSVIAQRWEGIYTDALQEKGKSYNRRR